MKNINKISRWQGAGLLATTLLGTGVFILPQITISIAQDKAIWTWLLLTLAIIPVTLIFGKLSAKHPHAAGPAFFVEKAFGKLAGRTIGLIFLLIVPLGVPAAILMTLTFVDALIPISGVQVLVAEFGVLVILYLLNHRGIQISAKLQFSLTLIIVSLVFVLLSLTGISDSEGVVPVSKNVFEDLSMSPILAAAGIAFWSFLGVEAMTHLADDFEDPARDMIPAMLIGTVLVGVVYIACTLLLLLVPTTNDLAMVEVFNNLVGGYGAQVIGILGIAGGLSSANVYTAGASRLVWSFSNDGVLPEYLSQKNSYGIPENALKTILALMALTLVITYFLDKSLEHLIAWCNGVFVIIYFACMLAAIKLLNGSNKLSIYLGMLFCSALAWGLGWQMSYAAMFMVFTALLLHWQIRLKSKRNLDSLST